MEVTDFAAGKTWYFAGECWLDAAQGDGMTERLLAASDKDPRADMIAYKVGVTADQLQGDLILSDWLMCFQGLRRPFGTVPGKWHQPAPAGCYLLVVVLAAQCTVFKIAHCCKLSIFSHS
jgi:hypothetical protein